MALSCRSSTRKAAASEGVPAGSRVTRMVDLFSRTWPGAASRLARVFLACFGLGRYGPSRVQPDRSRR